jgi:hypothetical protein
MVLCGSLHGDNADREAAWVRMEKVARQVQTLALEYGLGVHFSLAEYGVPFHAALLKHLGLGSDPHGYPSPGVVAFEVTSSPLMTCIEDAVPSLLDRRFTNVESSPLYSFLAKVLAMPELSSTFLLFESVGDHLIPHLSQIPRHEETTDEFLRRFTIPGRLEYGIFRLRAG